MADAQVDGGQVPNSGEGDKWAYFSEVEGGLQHSTHDWTGRNGLASYPEGRQWGRRVIAGFAVLYRAFWASGPAENGRREQLWVGLVTSCQRHGAGEMFRRGEREARTPNPKR